MAPLSGRMYFRGLKGRNRITINWPGVINFRSVVSISAAEYNPFQIDDGLRFPELPPPPPVQDDFVRFVGAADIFVTDISPHGPRGADPGGVTFALTVNWRDPLPVAVDVTVFDRPVDTVFPR